MAQKTTARECPHRAAFRKWTTASGRGYYGAMPEKPSNRIASIDTVSKLLVDVRVSVFNQAAAIWDTYRVARGAGYSILRSLEFALYYKGIPDDPEADAFDDAIARAEAESEAARKEVEQQIGRPKSSNEDLPLRS